MNERINSVSNICYNCDSDKSFMGRRGINKQKSNKKDLDLDFDSIFQKELKRVRKENLYGKDECHQIK